MIVFYDSTGRILSACAASSSSVAPPANPGSPLYLDDTEWADVWAHPARYLIAGGSPVLQPYLTLATATDTSTTPPTVTVTAMLNNPPPTPPAIALSVAGGTVTGDTMSVQVHPAVASSDVTCAVSAQGCVGASVQLGTAGRSVTSQLVGSASPYLVAPTQKAILRDYYAGLSGASQAEMLSVLSEALQNLYTVVSILAHAMVADVLPALQRTSYAPLTLSADQTNALQDAATNLLPQFALHLGTVYPSGGARVAQYQSVIDQAPMIAGAALAYQQDLAQIPGLV